MIHLHVAGSGRRLRAQAATSIGPSGSLDLSISRSPGRLVQSPRADCTLGQSELLELAGFEWLARARRLEIQPAECPFGGPRACLQAGGWQVHGLLGSRLEARGFASC